MNADPSCLLRNLDETISSGGPDSLHIAANLIRAQLRNVKTAPDTSIKVEGTDTETLQEIAESIPHNELLDSYIVCNDGTRSGIIRQELTRRLSLVGRK